MPGLKMPRFETAKNFPLILGLACLGTALPGVVKITANLPATKSRLQEEVALDTGLMKATSLLHKMFARKMIQSLEEENGEREEKVEVKSLVSELALRFQLMSKHTSFVAVDTKQGKEGTLVKVQVANQVPRGFLKLRGGGGGPMFCAAPMLGAPPPAPMAFGAAPARKKARSKSRECSASFGAAETCLAPPLGPGPRGGFSPMESSRSPPTCGAAPPPPPMGSRSDQQPVDAKQLQLDLLMQLICLQKANGSFPLQESLLALLKVSPDEVGEEKEGTEETVFATLLVLEALEVRFKDLQDSWEMVGEKAKKWIAAQNVEESVVIRVKNIINKPN